MGNEISPEILSNITSLHRNDSTHTAVENGKKFNIGEILGHINNKRENDENKPNIISKEEYTYGKTKGTLYRYDNGAAVFQYVKETNGTKIINEISFSKEKDIKNKKPSAHVSYDYKHPENKITKKYKYHRNGTLAHSQTIDNKGTVLRDIEYNKKGKPEEVKIYDKKGELIKQQYYTYNKNNTVEIATYDKNKKLQSTTSVQYAADGKTKVSSETKDANGNLISVTKYDEKGNIASSQEFHKNGKIKSETVYYDNGVIKTQVQYDEKGNVTNKISPEIDGEFGNSAQKSEGDCYLMAGINSIRNTEHGQEMLKDLVTVSTNDKGEKVYTVEFPGAKIAAEGLKTDDRIDPKKMYITGKYTFTESEMQEILKHAGKEYSLGDGDVILLEAAFEKYREEVDRTLDANNLDKKKNHIGEAGLQTGRDDENILAGGRPEDAVFILTGQTSQLYMNNKVENGLAYDALYDDEVNIVPIKKNTLKAVSEIDGEITASQKKLDKMLDDIMNDAKDGEIERIGVACFTVVHKDNSIGGHAFTIKSVTEDTVTLINPWHPDKELTMTRQEFLNSVRSVSLAQSKKGNGQINNGGNGTEPTPNPIKDPTPAHKPNNGGIDTSQTNPSGNPVVGKPYIVPQGMSYTNIIKSALEAQGIEPTPENIKKAKAQFEATNPGAVLIYNGKKQAWHGNKYLLVNTKVNIPQFKM